MLKLKKNVLGFIEANVKSEFIDDQVKMILENPPCPTGFAYWRFDGSRTRHGKSIQFTLTWDDFEEVEELKPYVWYPRGKFDGNPKNYIIVERTQQGVVYANYKDTIFDFTHHFMYIERFKRD